MMPTTALKTETSPEHFHGSDMEKIKEIYGINPEDIVSFSANVNPLGLPEKLLAELPGSLDALTSYPDREYTKLRKVIGAYCGADYRHIAVGNGSSELISLYIHAIAPKSALILGPTYSEYANEVEGAGGSFRYLELKEADDFRLDKTALFDELKKDTDLLVICNPNNPTSSVISRSDLDDMIRECKKHDVFVLIDETYVEFSDTEAVSAIPLCESYNNLAVLRGVSKFFSSPGLRLGYSICSDDILRDKVVSLQVPWSINSLAEVAGRLMFSDDDFIRRTKELIFAEKKRLYDMLSNQPLLKVYPPSANFILVRILKPSLKSGMVFDAAIRKCMMIRDCKTFPFLDDSYFRFCIMKPEDNDRLMNCILSLL